MSFQRSRFSRSSGAGVGAVGAPAGASYLRPISGQVGTRKTAATAGTTANGSATTATQNHPVRSMTQVPPSSVTRS